MLCSWFDGFIPRQPQKIRVNPSRSRRPARVDVDGHGVLDDSEGDCEQAPIRVLAGLARARSRARAPGPRAALERRPGPAARRRQVRGLQAGPARPAHGLLQAARHGGPGQWQRRGLRAGGGGAGRAPGRRRGGT
jgi:hypothetical protein